MPNIGPVELIIILVIALLILGPGRLPDVGSALGKSIREFRKAATDVQDAVKVDTTASAPVAPAPAPAAGPEAAPPPASAPAAAQEVAPAAVPPAPNTLAGETASNTLATPVAAAEPVAAEPVATTTEPKA